MALITNLQDLLNEMIADETIEDRREYSPDDLAKMYALGSQEADDLYWLIQHEFAADGNLKDLPKVSANAIIEGMVESLHGNFDGWDNEHDKITIMRFISDMVLYAQNS